MLDIKKIKENPDAVKAGLRAKEVDCDATVDRILELDEQRRALIADTEARPATCCTTCALQWAARFSTRPRKSWAVRWRNACAS